MTGYLKMMLPTAAWLEEIYVADIYLEEGVIVRLESACNMKYHHGIDQRWGIRDHWVLPVSAAYTNMM